MIAEVRCRSCHRHERWGQGYREVVSEGGGRAPTEPSGRAAWRVARASRAGELRVVGTCPCGQPLVCGADAGPDPVPVRIALPEGELVLEGGRWSLAGAPIDDATAERRVEAAFPLPPPDRVADAFAGSVALLVLVPVLVWVSLVGFVVVFLTGLGSAPFSEPP